MPHAAAIQDLVTQLMADPAGVLSAPFPLPSPTEFALSPVMTEAVTPGAALLTGVVVLPLVLVSTVARFGRGSAWLYAVGAIAPPVTLAVWPSIPAATWLALVGLLVLPLFGTVGFLADVGRYLLATR